MYPAPFRYHRPRSLAEALSLTAELGEGARALAGGQTLIPILKLRMDEPTDLVDIARLPGLRYCEQDGVTIRIGAMTTHARIANAAVCAAVPMLRDCAAGIADAQVRSRGTIGGSVSAADPSGDWPAVLHALDAEVVFSSARGERSLPIRDFIRDPYTTALGVGELVTEIRLPAPAPGSGGAYVGFKKTAPAYPTAAAGVFLELVDGDVCADVRLVLGAAGPRPVTSDEAEALLRNKNVTQARLGQAADALVANACPPDDTRGSPAFKKRVLRGLFLQAAEIAMRRAQGMPVEGSHAYV